MTNFLGSKIKIKNIKEAINKIASFTISILFIPIVYSLNILKH